MEAKSKNPTMRGKIDSRGKPVCPVCGCNQTQVVKTRWDTADLPKRQRHKCKQCEWRGWYEIRCVPA